MDPVRAGGAGRHDHEVGLGATQEADRRLVAALVDHVVDDAEAREALDQPGAVLGLGEQVEIPDALAPAPERAGGLDRVETGRLGQCRDESVDGRLRSMEQHPLGGGL